MGDSETADGDVEKEDASLREAADFEEGDDGTEPLRDDDTRPSGGRDDPEDDSQCVAHCERDGHGVCAGGVCYCVPGYYMPDCSAKGPLDVQMRRSRFQKVL